MNLFVVKKKKIKSLAKIIYEMSLYFQAWSRVPLNLIIQFSSVKTIRFMRDE